MGSSHIWSPHRCYCRHPNPSGDATWCRSTSKGEIESSSKTRCEIVVFNINESSRRSSSSTKGTSNTSSCKRWKRIRKRSEIIFASRWRLELYWVQPWMEGMVITSIDLCIGPGKPGARCCNQCSWLNSASMWMTSERTLSRLIHVQRFFLKVRCYLNVNASRAELFQRSIAVSPNGAGR